MLWLRKFAGVFTLLPSLWLLVSPAPVQAQTVFKELVNPTGVTADVGGNIFVHHQSGTQSVLSKFSAAGATLGSIVVAEAPVGTMAADEVPLKPMAAGDGRVSGRLITDRTSGQIIDLLDTGVLRFINASTLQIIRTVDLRDLTQDLTSVYDVATKALRQDFATFVTPANVVYGDIALLRQGSQLNLFITGSSAATPFILRLRLPADAASTVAPQAKMILVSSLKETREGVQPPGIAVNPQGTVLTTLPVSTGPSTLQSVAVGFNANLEPEQLIGANAPRFLFNQQAFPSNGIDSDPLGNFYVATAAAGTSLCGANSSGAVVIVPGTLDSVTCNLIGQPVANTQDITVNLAALNAYFTVSNLNVLIRSN